MVPWIDDRKVLDSTQTSGKVAFSLLVGGEVRHCSERRTGSRPVSRGFRDTSFENIVQYNIDGNSFIVRCEMELALFVPATANELALWSAFMEENKRKSVQKTMSLCD